MTNVRLKRFVSLLVFSGALLHCRETKESDGDLKSAPTPAPPPIAPVPALSEIEGGVKTDWVRAVRLGHWEDVWRETASLPDEVKQRPDVSWVRAKAALRLGQGEEAYRLLADLEKKLPLLSEEILEDRAHAALLAKRYSEAGELFYNRRNLQSLLSAASAFEKSLPERADAVCEELLRHPQRSRLDEAATRAMRIRLKLRTAKQDAGDAKWIIIHAPDAPEAKHALTIFSRLAPDEALTFDEELARAKAFAEAGMFDEALATYERAYTLPGRKPAPRERVRVKAETLFKARRWMEAFRAFEDLALAFPDRSSEFSLKAAKCLSRADRDEEAIIRYLKVAERYPKSKAADEATFLAARLHALHARWNKAFVDFEEYRKRFPRGEYRREALRYAAIGRYMSRDYREARKLFEELSADESDALEQAMARNFSALSALKEGDRTHAVATWNDIRKNRPFTWPAMVAEARLRELRTDALLDDRQALVPLSKLDVDFDLTLPSPVDLLVGVGLDKEAERALQRRESQIETKTSKHGIELLCEAYGRIDRGERLYEVSRQIPLTLLNANPDNANAWGWACAYPRPYRAEIEELEEKLKLPAGLVFAVMRQESNFREDALSPVGARGLMQLMPPTALEVSKALRASNASFPLIDRHSIDRLKDPHVNIALGARYLADLLHDTGGVAALAVAGYNGGPDSIEKWKKRQEGMDLDMFVEHIPFLETRDYVVRVMSHYARYSAIVSGKLPEIRLR